MLELLQTTYGSNIIYEEIIKNWDEDIINLLCNIIKESYQLIQSDGGRLYNKLLKKIIEENKTEIAKQLYESIKPNIEEIKKYTKFNKINELFEKLNLKF